MHCGQSETQIPASCDDVGTVNAQTPCMVQGETDGAGIGSAQRLGGMACQVTGHVTVEELRHTALNSTDAQWDTVVRELFWDTSCVDPVRHDDTITSSSITCTDCIGRRDSSCQLKRSYAINA